MIQEQRTQISQKTGMVAIVSVSVPGEEDNKIIFDVLKGKFIK